MTDRRARWRFLPAWLLTLSATALAADPPPAPPRTFAVEFRTGPRWDPARPAGEQAGFADHSARLQQLRKDGRIVLGARYGDKGLVVFSGSSREEVKALVEADPSVAGGTFAYELHELSVFYPGCLERPAPRPAATPAAGPTPPPS